MTYISKQNFCSCLTYGCMYADSPKKGETLKRANPSENTRPQEAMLRQMRQGANFLERWVPRVLFALTAILRQEMLQEQWRKAQRSTSTDCPQARRQKGCIAREKIAWMLDEKKKGITLQHRMS